VAIGLRGELGDFLRRRREALTPAAAGIAVGERRRTPGLRREEVAERAHMSIVYYERLERGDDQREHLYRLAGQVAPPTPEPAGYVDPGLTATLSAFGPSYPATIVDELGVILVQNRMCVHLLGEMSGHNLLVRWFGDSAWRELQEPVEQHEGTGRAFVADLRTVVARRDRDSRAVELVEELRGISAGFARMWDEHAVSSLHCSAKRFFHPREGRIDLDCAVLLSPLSTQRLLMMRPEPGSAAEDQLARIVDTWLSPGKRP
jgi:transcriptional regulator with XRE-family HTH domain